MDLHEGVVARRAAVDAQLVEGEAAVVLQGLEHVSRLERDALQGGARQVSSAGAAAHAEHGAAGVGVPVRGAQTRECRHQHDSAAVRHARRQLLDVGGGADDAEAVAQPLDDRAGREHATFQRELGGQRRRGEAHGTLRAADRLVAAPSDGAEQVVGGRYRLGPGVQHQEATGAVGVLGVAGGEAGLTEGRCLLVAGQRGERHAGQRPVLDDLHDTGGRDELRKDRNWDVEDVGQAVAPRLLGEVEQQRTRRVADVGGVDPAAGEARREPAVDGAEGQLAGQGALAGALDRVEQPGDLAGGEVRVEQQPRGGPHLVADARVLEAVDDAGRAAVLPDDRVVDGLQRLAIPDHRRLALVGDAHRGEVVCLEPGVAESLGGDADLRRPDLQGVVLHPAGAGVVLLELLLGDCLDLALPVEHDGSRAGRALVQREHEAPLAVAHGASGSSRRSLA